MRGTALCCALLVCGGCSLFLSTNDLAGDAPDGGGPIDASADGPPTVVSDGGTDTGPSNDAAVSFCKSLSPAPKHCADFDDGNLIGVFDKVVRDPSATTTVVAESGGVRAAINGADGCTYAALAKTVPASGQGMRIRFKVKPTASSWPKDLIYFFMNLEDGLNDCGFLLHLGENGDYAWLHPQWGNPEQNDSTDFLAVPKVGEWSEIGIDFAAVSTPTISITVNGKPAITSKAYGQCTFGSGVYVAMGFHCASGTGEVQYDDLVIDYP